MKNSVTRTWKIWSDLYAYVKEKNGLHYDWSNETQGIRIVDVQPIEGNGTGECGWLVVKITRNTAEECGRELEGQLSDGLFENSSAYVEKELTEADYE